MKIHAIFWVTALMATLWYGMIELSNNTIFVLPVLAIPWLGIVGVYFYYKEEKRGMDETKPSEEDG